MIKTALFLWLSICLQVFTLRLPNPGLLTRSAILNSKAGRESHRPLSSCCFLSGLRLPSQRLDFARITRFSVTTRSPASFVTLSRTHSPAARPLLGDASYTRAACIAMPFACHCNCHCNALPCSPFWEIVLWLPRYLWVNILQCTRVSISTWNRYRAWLKVFLVFRRQFY